jgi:hypothetical protein
MIGAVSTVSSAKIFFAAKRVTPTRDGGYVANHIAIFIC